MEGTVWTLVPVEGKPTWIQSPDPAKGAPRPRSTTGTAQIFAIDATQLAQAPGATSSLDEVTMADAVPMALRVSMREEVLEQTVDADAKEAAELILKKRHLKSRQEQSFQVFHPEAAKALDIQSKAIQHTHLIHQEAMEDADMKRQKTELVDEAASLNMQVLGPLQEGMHSAPDSSRK